MIVEVMFDNGIVCAQEFPNISTRDYYIPDINIDTTCRHSFDTLELVLNRHDDADNELSKEIRSRNIKTLDCAMRVSVAIDSQFIQNAKNSIDKTYFEKQASRPWGHVHQVKILSYETFDGEVVDCSDLVFSDALANALARSHKTRIIKAHDNKYLTLDSDALCIQVFH